MTPREQRQVSHIRSLLRFPFISPLGRGNKSSEAVFRSEDGSRLDPGNLTSMRSPRREIMPPSIFAWLGPVSLRGLPCGLRSPAKCLAQRRNCASPAEAGDTVVESFDVPGLGHHGLRGSDTVDATAFKNQSCGLEFPALSTHLEKAGILQSCTTGQFHIFRQSTHGKHASHTLPGRQRRFGLRLLDHQSLNPLTQFGLYYTGISLG